MSSITEIAEYTDEEREALDFVPPTDEEIDRTLLSMKPKIVNTQEGDFQQQYTSERMGTQCNCNFTQGQCFLGGQ